MRNILTIDVEDYFQVSDFDQFILKSQWDHFESRVEKNTLKILKILSRENVKGTFFILGWIAERYPQLVKTIHFEGHEVACHGYSHRLVYEQTPEEFRKESRVAKAILEDIVGTPVLSYRAASYSITRRSGWALEILAQEGFKYDSSIFPIVHDRYGIPRAFRQPHVLNFWNGLELIEFPMSTLRLFGMNLPVGGGGYFRLFPYALTRAAIRRLNREDKLPVVFYLHPWEFDPQQPVLATMGLSRFRHYLNLSQTEFRFCRLLNDFNFTSLSSAAASLHFDHQDVQQLLGICGGPPKDGKQTAL
ncbi:MAG: polysaccharide deacetylase [Acidobacteria bacterium]|nr:MAG: polysaccharide deacetylase [Acidobacteriota bacterium]